MKKHLPYHMGGKRSRRGQVKRFGSDARRTDIPQRNVGDAVAAAPKRLRVARSAALVAALFVFGVLGFLLWGFLH
ncbi:MAG: hypothetical protein KGH79_04235 [Patescibacteria group bacterium]|nr:hypothetical protein [Patescibacteria group bacterium]